jgi:hypothetical protein
MTNFTPLPSFSSEGLRGCSGEPNSQLQILSPHPSLRPGLAMGGLKECVVRHNSHASTGGTPVQTTNVRFSTANDLILF